MNLSRSLQNLVCLATVLTLVVQATADDRIRLATAESDLSWQDVGSELAKRVVIHRDAYGVPHVVGEDEKSIVFGFAYAQCEDHFWQIEDTYILSLGRYSEIQGPRGLNSDLLNRSFQVVSSSKRDFPGLDAQTRSLCKSFAAGLNYYLLKHPHVQPRMIREFQPWHVLAFYRHMTLELCYRYTRLSDSFLPRHNRRIWAATGSNAWAIGPARTASGGTMLMVNPHLPWYGMAQLYEAHLICRGDSGDQSWNFTGATFLGSPVLTIGHNEHLGWTMTTNEPDIADVWRVTFPDPDSPEQYEYDNQKRTAQLWTDTVRVRRGGEMEERVYQLRRTHQGVVVGREDDRNFLVANISGLYDTVPMQQGLRMMKSTNLSEFKDAIALLQLPYMNIVYADRDGNIFYLYGARAPRRDPRFDWSKPVDGSDPATAWDGIHGLEELPQVLNPPSGFIQNCNSSPYITSDGGNPAAEQIAPYLVGDADQHKRRALRSLEMLRTMREVTLDDFQAAAFDTTIYWAVHEMPKITAQWESLRKTNPELAEQVQPLVDHFAGWNGKISADSTAATLCEAWYEQLYGTEYPGERMHESYHNNPAGQFEALVVAADRLHRLHGDWKVPYGRIHRIQRQPYEVDLFALRFADRGPSLPCLGGHGPMGVIFTQYYTPSIHIPLVMQQKKRYGVVGPVYLAVYEFTADGVQSRSVVPYGASGMPESPHFFDQAELLSATHLKTVPFTESAVRAASVRSYQPGEPAMLP